MASYRTLILLRMTNDMIIWAMQYTISFALKLKRKQKRERDVNCWIPASAIAQLLSCSTQYKKRIILNKLGRFQCGVTVLFCRSILHTPLVVVHKHKDFSFRPTHIWLYLSNDGGESVRSPNMHAMQPKRLQVLTFVPN